MTQSRDSILDRDVLLAETSGSAQGEARSGFPIEVPEWAPACIERYAREYYGDFRQPPGFNAILLRLTTDPRMRVVWTHLTRRRRSDRRFFQPTRMKCSWTSDPDKVQEFALLQLFLWVLELALSRPRALLRREVEEVKKNYRAFASEAWATADMLAYLEEIGEANFGQAKILSEAGGVYYRLSCKDLPGDIVVERDRDNRETRAVATAIAGTCVMLFGDALYKVTAALTAVALDRPVEHREVRQWWKDRPIEPSADKGGFFGALSAVSKPRT
jgi:hypothetical protein